MLKARPYAEKSCDTPRRSQKEARYCEKKLLHHHPSFPFSSTRVAWTFRYCESFAFLTVDTDSVESLRICVPRVYVPSTKQFDISCTHIDSMHISFLCILRSGRSVFSFSRRNLNSYVFPLSRWYLHLILTRPTFHISGTALIVYSVLKAPQFPCSRVRFCLCALRRNTNGNTSNDEVGNRVGCRRRAHNSSRGVEVPFYFRCAYDLKRMTFRFSSSFLFSFLYVLKITMLFPRRLWCVSVNSKS